MVIRKIIVQKKNDIILLFSTFLINVVNTYISLTKTCSIKCKNNLNDKSNNNF